MVDLCEICHKPFTDEDLEDDVTVPADCCERIGLCSHCREEGNHDCDEDREPTRAKPIIVGEMNPYGADPYYALYPAPDGCSGHRLCCLILGMQRAAYLDAFERVNLCEGKWSIKAARVRAEQLADFGTTGIDEGQPLILLGSKVASAFQLPFRPFEQFGEDLLVLPHPSGLCRLWQQPDAIAKARAAVLRMCPELAPLIKE